MCGCFVEAVTAVNPLKLEDLKFLIMSDLDDINPRISDRLQTGGSSAPLVVGIAGGSGSGKTTITDEIVRRIGHEYLTVISHDNYYRDWSHLPKEERDAINFDHPYCLETDLLVQHLRELKDLKAVSIPSYDFTTHTRRPGTVEIKASKVIIVEGILIFSDPGLCDLLDIKIFVDTPDDLRLIRRISRDVSERGRTYDSVIQQYLKTVRPMHMLYVEQTKRNANLIVPGESRNPEAISAITMFLRQHLLENNPN